MGKEGKGLRSKGGERDEEGMIASKTLQNPLLIHFLTKKIKNLQLEGNKKWTRRGFGGYPPFTIPFPLPWSSNPLSPPQLPNKP